MKKTLFKNIASATILFSLAIINSQKLSAHKFSDKNDLQNVKKFEPTDVSLEKYNYPEWFRDAKFGIWAVWGPSAVPRQGDWFGKRMYIEDIYDRHIKEYTGVPDKDYTFALENYGPQSKFGFKDLIPMWKAEKFDPYKLMKMYKDAGAKYFVSIASHHDNFFLWNSKIHRWNSVKMGPHRDIVGDWQKAAKKEGLKFGVSEHLAASYTWFQTAHNADKKGPYAGIPYDANDPKFADLYHSKADPNDNQWLTNNAEWHEDWANKINELVDMYHPDLLYSDSSLPFGDVGRGVISHFYNTQLDKKGNTNVVYNCKHGNSMGRYVKDYERGSAIGIQKYPWQTDTSIGDWVFKENDKYKTSTQIIQMLVDIVSKNGNLLLNVAPTPEGEIDPQAQETLKNIGLWLKDNGDAIYGSRPWNVYGEGPSTVNKQEKGQFDGIKDVRPYTSDDIRFTYKDENIYVFVMNHPSGKIIINSKIDKKIKSIKLLSSGSKVNFTHKKGEPLIIDVPSSLPSYDVVVFKIKI